MERKNPILAIVIQSWQPLHIMQQDRDETSKPDFAARQQPANSLSGALTPAVLCHVCVVQQQIQAQCLESPIEQLTMRVVQQQIQAQCLESPIEQLTMHWQP